MRSLIVHQLPLIAFPWRGGIEPDVGFHGNGAGSTKLGIGARTLAGTDAIAVQRAPELGVLTV